MSENKKLPTGEAVPLSFRRILMLRDRNGRIKFVLATARKDLRAPPEDTVPLGMHSGNSRRPYKENAFLTLLRPKGVWPLDPNSDWSGRGQHVEFQPSERDSIPRLLEVKALLGSTFSAAVESVKCKKIYLARKTISCGRYINKEQAIDEVAHLNQVQHSHIVRVVGTYSIAKQLSILLYPVAEYNLETFLREMSEYSGNEIDDPQHTLTLTTFFGYLCNALAYIHSKMT
ncbi:hypothetical protein BU23DRAFT_594482 [Bimuria novae-zelandiae CBS 107.79]|uniref:Protein kinase domain-containing protein n=1 Tax=Bimuria novae-zelandiae CBS 107.79 TaxID=1447943 RepID=A0A6A5VZ49_9PLEO|nr:hypothetical protein BU23DRAFT_594482 [Bimuria novae-zelandiae CBS 107.79]